MVIRSEEEPTERQERKRNMSDYDKRDIEEKTDELLASIVSIFQSDGLRSNRYAISKAADAAIKYGAIGAEIVQESGWNEDGKATFRLGLVVNEDGGTAYPIVRGEFACDEAEFEGETIPLPPAELVGIAAAFAAASESAHELYEVLKAREEAVLN